MASVRVLLLQLAIITASCSLAKAESLRFLGQDQEWVALKDVVQPIAVSKPIDNSREAIEVAKDLGLLKQSNLSQLQLKGYKDWVVIVGHETVNAGLKILHDRLLTGEISEAKKKSLSEDLIERGDVWLVQLRSMGKEPSYSCRVEITPNAEAVQKDFRCGFK